MIWLYREDLLAIAYYLSVLTYLIYNAKTVKQAKRDILIYSGVLFCMILFMCLTGAILSLSSQFPFTTHEVNLTKTTILLFTYHI